MVNVRFHCAHAGRFEGSGGAAIAGGGAGAGSALALAFARRSSRLWTVRHAGRAGAPSSMTPGSGGGAANAGGGGSSCWIVRPSVIGLRWAGGGTKKTHLGHPFWIKLAPRAELGLDGHEFRYLAVEGIEGGRDMLGLSGGTSTDGDSGWNILLELAALVSQLADLCEEDADFAGEGFAEVIQVPADDIPREVIRIVLSQFCMQAYFGGAG